MTTTLSTFTLSLNGLRVGAGQPIRITEVRGLDDMPEVRTDDQPRTYGDGDVDGDDAQAGRVVEVDLSLAGRDLAGSLTALRRALANPIGDMGELQVVGGLPGMPPLRMRGKVRRASIPTDRALALGHSTPRFAFYSPDPRLYGSEVVAEAYVSRPVQQSAPVRYDDPVPYDSPAVDYDAGRATVNEPAPIAPPFVFPVVFGGSSLGASVVATNEGPYATWPVVRVYGPTPPFSLIQSVEQHEVRYRETLPAGQFVDFDMRNRRVLLNGVASRRDNMSGTWFSLPPGQCTVTFSPREAAPSAHFELRYSSAY